jgi:hypothetical protein
MTGSLLAILGILAVTVLGAWFYHFVWPGLMKFRKLRHNIIQEMATCARVLTPTVGGTAAFALLHPVAPETKANVKAKYHDLASQLVAFQQNEPIAAWVISRWYDLNKASEGLSKLSQSIGDPDEAISPSASRPSTPLPSVATDASHEGVVQRALRV